MHILDRRCAFNEAMVVEKGIWLATHHGISSAFDYMQEHGIPDDVAARVLAGPEYQRNSSERRSGRGTRPGIGRRSSDRRGRQLALFDEPVAESA